MQWIASNQILSAVRAMVSRSSVGRRTMPSLRMTTQPIMDDVDHLSLDDLIKDGWQWHARARAELRDYGHASSGITTGWLSAVETMLQNVQDRRNTRLGDRPRFDWLGFTARRHAAEERADKELVRNFCDRERSRRR